VERVREELARLGCFHGDKLIRKRLRANEIEFKYKRKTVKTTDSGHSEPFTENLQYRDFRAAGPNMICR